MSDLGRLGLPRLLRVRCGVPEQRLKNILHRTEDLKLYSGLSSELDDPRVMEPAVARDERSDLILAADQVVHHREENHGVAKANILLALLERRVSSSGHGEDLWHRTLRELCRREAVPILELGHGLNVASDGRRTVGCGKRDPGLLYATEVIVQALELRPHQRCFLVQFTLPSMLEFDLDAGRQEQVDVASGNLEDVLQVS